tara:strand:+ start:1943 stop:2098 length:156 start_codon:yes stop_codon:yes gene_type:complete
VKEKHEKIPAERSAGIFFVIGQYGPEGFCQKPKREGRAAVHSGMTGAMRSK